MNKNDIDFLNNLQNEMNTQDTCCQADPRFWVIMQKKRVYGIDEDYEVTGTIITSSDDCELEIEIDDTKSIYNFLIEELEVDCKLIDGYIQVYNDEEDVLYDEDDLINFLDNEGYDEYRLVNYRDEEEIVQDTFFLTRRECEEHIKMNSYHYRNAHPYAMTAWRSPQVERLYKILQETNWNELKEGN
ncbi:hypothetical protein FDF26_13665 [Clostridium botulinum]|uniref:hypothetical protein n=1 Tax=Clostridium sp. M14 TaxID=2716311 RepID=UPI0013EEE900|nr:hypothetical protein [Clostridium sp. M14]MBZ9693245.1 hypothetical protein [Clostridium sp. M14]NFT08091.1 hypothetical protein [Clostridium botulinum]